MNLPGHDENLTEEKKRKVSSIARDMLKNKLCIVC